MGLWRAKPMFQRILYRPCKSVRSQVEAPVVEKSFILYSYQLSYAPPDSNTPLSPRRHQKAKYAVQYSIEEACQTTITTHPAQPAETRRRETGSRSSLLNIPQVHRPKAAQRESYECITLGQGEVIQVISQVGDSVARLSEQ